MPPYQIHYLIPPLSPPAALLSPSISKIGCVAMSSHSNIRSNSAPLFSAPVALPLLPPIPDSTPAVLLLVWPADEVELLRSLERRKAGSAVVVSMSDVKP